MHKCGDSHSASLGEAKRRPGAEYGDGEDEEEVVGAMIEEEEDDISLALSAVLSAAAAMRAKGKQGSREINKLPSFLPLIVAL